MLPQICVKTGEPVPHNMLSKRFVWCSPIVGLLIFLSPLVLIVVYLVVRKEVRRYVWFASLAAKKLSTAACHQGPGSDRPVSYPTLRRGIEFNARDNHCHGPISGIDSFTVYRL